MTNQPDTKKDLFASLTVYAAALKDFLDVYTDGMCYHAVTITYEDHQHHMIEVRVELVDEPTEINLIRGIKTRDELLGETDEEETTRMIIRRYNQSHPIFLYEGPCAFIYKRRRRPSSWTRRQARRDGSKIIGDALKNYHRT